MPPSSTSGPLWGRDHISGSAEEIARLEAASKETTRSERVADRIMAICGSMPFIAVHAVWFTSWIVVNLPGSPLRFDEFPFGLLTTIVSLEAIFLAMFVLTSQNRQSAAADRRARVDLQVNVIAEREVTRLVQLVAEVHEHFGLANGHRSDDAKMSEKTPVSDIVDAMDEADDEIGAHAAE